MGLSTYVRQNKRNFVVIYEAQPADISIKEQIKMAKNKMDFKILFISITNSRLNYCCRDLSNE